MNEKKKITKPKKKTCKKKKTSVKNTSAISMREKTYGDPALVKPLDDYNNTKTSEIYPKIFFRQDSLWYKIKRFFGFTP
jgi:hypothetical protein